ncbi:30S ribosomal protein S8, partial [candidate division WOR-3 bacterium]|nr:30S ribosomal protein S8 [candidate division WOR-3 bacterium]
AEHKEVELPASLMKLGIADVLKREGYIKDYKSKSDKKQGIIKISLKSKPVIQGLERISKPGRRVYTGIKDIPIVKDGIGIAILSTPQGILSSREAKQAKVGGEILAHIW